MKKGKKKTCNQQTIVRKKTKIIISEQCLTVSTANVTLQQMKKQKQKTK